MLWILKNDFINAILYLKYYLDTKIIIIILSVKMVEKHLKNKHPSCLLYKTHQPSNQASVIQPNPSVTPVRKDSLFI